MKPEYCPECGGDLERDDVDDGGGMEAVGSWGCPDCHWVEGEPLICTCGHPEDQHKMSDTTECVALRQGGVICTCKEFQNFARSKREELIP